MKRKKRGLSKDYVGFYFVLPFFIVYLFWGLYPVIKTFMLAFFKYDAGINTGEFVGFKYIQRAIFDENVWTGIITALKLWGYQFFFELLSALFIAAIFTYQKIKGAHAFKSIFYLPNLVSTAAIATLFSLFMGFPEGVFNQIALKLNWISEPVMFQRNQFILQLVVVFIGWWMWYGRTSIVAGAGMTSISDDIYEAAKIDGATFRQIFRKITIPLIRPVLTFMMVTSLIGGIQSFDLPFMIAKTSDGGPNGILQTISMYIYKHGFEVGNVGYAAAISIILFIVLSILSLTFYRIMNGGHKSEK